MIEKNGNLETTLRNKDFISNKVQRELAIKTFLIAGCGSVGGSAIEPLVRTGARKFILADPDSYDYTNLNRQSTGYKNVGENKAKYMKEKIEWINPVCFTEVHTSGLTQENISEIIEKTDFVIDGVDVTTRSGWEAKYMLHQKAREKGIPVISGYDMDATQYVVLYDYREDNEKLFHGKIHSKDFDAHAPLDLCLLLIGEKNLPLGIIDELKRLNSKEKGFISQLAIAANLYGIISVSMIIQILQQKVKIKKEVYLDLWELLENYSYEETYKIKQERILMKNYIDELKEKDEYEI